MQGGGVTVVVEDFEAAFVFGIETPVFGFAVVEEVEDAAGRQAVVMVMGFALGKVDLRDETERGFAVVGPGRSGSPPRREAPSGMCSALWVVRVMALRTSGLTVCQ